MTRWPLRTMVLSALAGVCLPAAVVVVGCKEPAQPAASDDAGRTAPSREEPRVALRANVAASDAGATVMCPDDSGRALQLAPGVPGDITPSANQSQFDCYAWQEFIGLNWPSASAPDGGPPSQFGDPSDTGPTVWETFMDAAVLFNMAGTAPPAWGMQPPPPASCQAAPGAGSLSASHAAVLYMSSSFIDVLDPSASHQATPPPNWLGAQSGQNVWYDIKVDQDEYDYIADAGLYNASNQAAFYADGGAQISLPMGQLKFGSTIAVGAIELKASWVVVTDPTNAKWTRYKRSPAFLYDPTSGACTSVTVALVALHVIHKTSSQPTWIWATFEQVDNVHEPDAGAPAGGYTFASAPGSCTPNTLTVSSACLPDSGTSFDGGTSSVTISCTPNAQPPYNLGPGCPPAPIQVARATAIDGNAMQANELAQAFIRSANPSSVWQYYELVNVIWSTDPPITQPRKQPLTVKSLQPAIPVANTTLETYAQNKKCTDCHVHGSIVGKSGFESDFSFVFSLAGAVTAQATPMAVPKSSPPSRSAPRPKRPW